jgi:hypothetical protein
MTRSIHSFVIACACASSVFGCGRITGGGASTEGDADMESGSDLPAFPGAQGFGATTNGGRGGTVYEVTNLDDSGPGSLRDAVGRGCASSARVDGTIESTRRSRSSHITIAPDEQGGGITLSGEEVRVTHDVVIRHLRIRPAIVVPVDGWDNRTHELAPTTS